MSIKKYSKLSVFCLLGFALYGCSNLSEQIEVRLEPELSVDPLTYEVRDITRVVVTSLANDPINIQSISVNRGACGSRMVKGSKQLSGYGSLVKFQLSNCDMAMVKEVELTMNGQDYIYEF